MKRAREVRRGWPIEIGWLLVALTTLLPDGCGPQRPFDPTRVNPDVAMEPGMQAVQMVATSHRSRAGASFPRFVRIAEGAGGSAERSVAARVPARQIVVVPAGESILSLVRKLARRPLTVREEAEVIAEVKRLNPHIFNPDVVRPGTRVVLPGCIGCDAEAERDGGV